MLNKGIVFSAEGKAFEKYVSIEKLLGLKNNELTIVVTLQNIDLETIRGIYGLELNFGLLGGHSDDRYYKINGKKPTEFYLDAKSSELGISQIDIINEYDGFQILNIFNELFSNIYFQHRKYFIKARLRLRGLDDRRSLPSLVSPYQSNLLLPLP